MNWRIERLERLATLRDKGALTDTEFQQEKGKVLVAAAYDMPPAIMPSQETQIGKVVPAEQELSYPVLSRYYEILAKPIPLRNIIIAVSIAGLLGVSFWMGQSEPPTAENKSEDVKVAREEQRSLEERVEWEPVTKCSGGSNRMMRCKTEMRPKVLTFQ